MRCLPAGPSALLVEVDGQDAVFSLTAAVTTRLAGEWQGRITDVVPGASTVLLDGIADPAALAAEIASWELPAAAPPVGDPVEIPCRYGGPDLSFVAARWGVADSELPALHASMEHRAAFCGFTPGFAYLAGLGAHHAVPRLDAPRPVVRAGSVAVAGTFTGIYPRTSPGGWRIIGHTDIVLWDAERDPPALLVPGTPVRFVEA